jgi:hypothetical protein
MWASRPAEVSSPIFNTYDALKSSREPVKLDTEPRFVTFTTGVEGDAQRNFISLAPLLQSLDRPLTVYYDGLVVLPGEWPLDQAPVFDDASGTSGRWGGQAFKNLLRNPSAESAWLRLRPEIDRLGARLLPDKGSNQPSVTLYYLLDNAGAGMFQRFSAQVLFRTFWARFGWGNVPLMTSWPYWVILGSMLVGLIGAIVSAWRQRKVFPWSAALLLGLALFLVWLQAFLRGANYATQLRAIYYPTARYAYPVIIPMMLLLNLGWYELGRFLEFRLHAPRRGLEIFFVAGWLTLNLYAILSIANFYYL